MSTRPQRVSRLAGTSSVRPSHGAQSDPGALSDTEAPTIPVEAAEPHTAPPSAQAKQAPKATNAGKSQVGIYMRTENLERARRAHLGTVIHTGTRFWSDFVEEAVMAHAKRLEQQYNDAKPF